MKMTLITAIVAAAPMAFAAGAKKAGETISIPKADIARCMRGAPIIDGVYTMMDMLWLTNDLEGAHELQTRDLHACTDFEKLPSGEILVFRVVKRDTLTDELGTRKRLVLERNGTTWEAASWR